MQRWLLVLIVTLLAAPVQAQPVLDFAREDRWAQEVVPSLVVGDAVYLATTARPQVLAILTEASGRSKGGVIVIHGLGVHPDFGFISGLRTGLAEAGYTTLSVQMPVLAATASRDDYRVALPDAGDRIAAALRYLRAKGITRIALVSHSMGATMANAYLAGPDAQPIDAWVPIGMFVDFALPPKEPVLDVMAGNELPQVVAAAPLRAMKLRKDRCSRQATIPGTDHYFENHQKELVATIAEFLQWALNNCGLVGRVAPSLQGCAGQSFARRPQAPSASLGRRCHAGVARRPRCGDSRLLAPLRASREGPHSPLTPRLAPVASPRAARAGPLLPGSRR